MQALISKPPAADHGRTDGRWVLHTWPAPCDTRLGPPLGDRTPGWTHLCSDFISLFLGSFIHLLPISTSPSLSLTPNIFFKSTFYKKAIVSQVWSVAKPSNELSPKVLGSFSTSLVLHWRQAQALFPSESRPTLTHLHLLMTRLQNGE